MTIHRVTQDQLIIEDCRRQQQIPFTGIHEPNVLWEEKRSTTHDYSKKWARFWKRVEPQPKCKRLIWDADEYSYVTSNDVMLHPCPISPQDRIVMLRKWWNDPTGDKEGPAIAPDDSEFVRQYDWESAETMPESLDSQCEQYVVKQVLGVEGKVLLQPKNGESGLCNPENSETIFYFFGIAHEVE